MSDAVTFYIKKGTPLAQIRQSVYDVLMGQSFNVEGHKIQIDPTTALMEFTPKCGCEPFTMSIEEMPLEDLSCPCGGTKLIKFEWTDEDYPKSENTAEITIEPL